MRFRVVPFLTLPLLAQALPTIRRTVTSHTAAPITTADDVMMFDGFGYPGPSEGDTVVHLQAFAFNKVELYSHVSTFITSLEHSDPNIPLERLKMFGVPGESGKDIAVRIDGCGSRKPQITKLTTADNGLVLSDISIGSCPSKNLPLTATVQLALPNSRQINSTIFNSPSEGFGVISGTDISNLGRCVFLISYPYTDIDDTIKISHVRNKGWLLKTTFAERAQPVPGMPELYAHLAGALAKSYTPPLFVYVSGSPFQLFPFLHGYIDSSFPKSRGPILLRELTRDVEDLIHFIEPGEVKEYKLDMIDRIYKMYPKKKFLAIGDSGEFDPETYGEA